MEDWIFLPFVLIVVMLVLCLILGLFRLSDFLQELRYLNIELQRARRSERRHWEKRRRRLWLSLFFPFVKY